MSKQSSMETKLTPYNATLKATQINRTIQLIDEGYTLLTEVPDERPVILIKAFTLDPSATIPEIKEDGLEVEVSRTKLGETIPPIYRYMMWVTIPHDVYLAATENISERIISC